MSSSETPPRLIQGGMGVAVSGWRLANAVSRTGQLGVVSGTALAVVLARRLQDGDPGGHMRRALAAFPNRATAEAVLDRYLTPEGHARKRRYRAVPVPRLPLGRQFVDLTVLASFAEVYLAKEGTASDVGMNLMEKIQIPTLPALYGAMLAGVDWVLMGAGIPDHIPAVLDALSEQRPTELPVTVSGAIAGKEHTVSFDPQKVVPEPGDALSRPRFLAIVSSHVLASHLARSEEGRPWGFVVEHPIAGGHNAPPRGRLQLSERGEPVYGPRDEVDFERMRELGLPFWLAGGYGHPERLRDALDHGASGVQVGTAFALCEESGLDPALRTRAREAALAGRLQVDTDPVASPTGYPFKVARLPGTAAAPTAERIRDRRCDLGYLSTPYQRPNGGLGYRCPGEPEDEFVAKGGPRDDTYGRLCLCNGLVAAAGMPQDRGSAGPEVPLLTLGDEVHSVLAALSPEGRPYHAEDVVSYVLGEAAVRSSSAV